MNHDGDDLCFAGAAKQAHMVRHGEVTARQLVEATLQRIEKLNPTLNAYRVVLGSQALAEADRIDAAGPASFDGPGSLLLGVPVAIKDTVGVKGEVTTWGSSANTTPAAADDPIVAALRDAGAIIIGKTTSSELATWPFTETEAWGQTRNPWNTDYSPGGSSGGSGAAVAAGLCGVALGSDGLGSIRLPAAFNGVFGIKPQRDRVWHSDDNWNGLSVNGPIARTVADAALFLQATQQTAPPEAFVQAVEAEPSALRVAVVWNTIAKYPLAARVGKDQRRAVTETIELLEQLGHTVHEHKLSHTVHATNHMMHRYLAGVAHGAKQLEDASKVSRRTRAMAFYGRLIPAGQLRRSLAREEKISAAINKVFDNADVVLTAAHTQPPTRIGQLDGWPAMATLTVSGRRIPFFPPWNLIGQPAATVPAGFDKLGLPLSVQLAGRPNDEALLLSLAAQLEQARPWAHQRPPVGAGTLESRG